MNIVVRYFASIREAAGTASESLDTEAGTIAELRTVLLARGGALAEARRVAKPGAYVVIVTWGRPEGMEAASLHTL